MRRILSSEARKELSDIIHRAYYKEEITIITKHGRDIAAVVPVTALATTEDLITKKPARPSGRR